MDPKTQQHNELLDELYSYFHIENPSEPVKKERVYFPKKVKTDSINEDSLHETAIEELKNLRVQKNLLPATTTRQVFVASAKYNQKNK